VCVVGWVGGVSESCDPVMFGSLERGWVSRPPIPNTERCLSGIGIGVGVAEESSDAVGSVLWGVTPRPTRD